jgi:hypothetical protein
MTNGYVLSEVAIKTVYVSLTTAALLLVFTLLLTGSHPLIVALQKISSNIHGGVEAWRING